MNIWNYLSKHSYKPIRAVQPLSLIDFPLCFQCVSLSAMMTVHSSSTSCTLVFKAQMRRSWSMTGWKANPANTLWVVWVIFLKGKYKSETQSGNLGKSHWRTARKDRPLISSLDLLKTHTFSCFFFFLGLIDFPMWPLHTSKQPSSSSSSWTVSWAFPEVWQDEETKT